MNITCQISKKDFTAYINFLQQRVGRLAKIPLSWRAVSWVLLVLLFVSVDRILKTDLIRELLPVSADTFLMVFAAIVFLGYNCLYFKVSSARMISMMATEGGPFVGDFSLELVSDGFVVTSPYIQGKYDWKVIQDVEENEDFIYILIDNGGGLQIPKSIFSSPQETQDFVEIFASKARG